MASPGTPRSGEVFNEEYYRTGLGPLAYERSNAELLRFFGNIADELIRALHPKNVLDAGCAMGFLVEAFWDRGIQAHGIDISSYAISQVRRDMIPFCSVASLTEPIARRYDLVTCIEVLEHMPEEEARLSVQSLVAATDTILFSSSPTDLTEPTHINVKQPIAWLELFAEAGFYPDLMFDASFVAPQAILFRRTDRVLDWEVLRLVSELIRYKNTVVHQAGQMQQLSAEAAESKLAAEAQRHIMITDQQQNAQALTSLQDATAGLRSQIEQLEKQLEQNRILGSDLERYRASLEKLQSEFQHVASQNAVLVEGMENAFSASNRLQHESQTLIDQSTADIASFRHILRTDVEERFNTFDGHLRSMQRKLDTVELASWESRLQLAEILQSRIWKSLKSLGGIILKLTPGRH